jgi:hypothetical protein
MATKIKRLMVIGLAALLAFGTGAFGRADVAAGKDSNHDKEGPGGRVVAAIVPWANGWGHELARTEGRSIRGTGGFGSDGAAAKHAPNPTSGCFCIFPDGN